MNIEATNSNVVIKRVKPKKLTDGGIIIPEKVNVIPPQVGEIISVGKNVVDLKVGDMVIFSSYMAVGMELEKVEYAFMESKNILAILSNHLY